MYIRSYVCASMYNTDETTRRLRTLTKKLKHQFSDDSRVQGMKILSYSKSSLDSVHRSHRSSIIAKLINERKPLLPNVHA